MDIGLDLDGVINDPVPLKREWAMRLFGVEILPEKCKREHVLGDGLLTDEQYTELQRRIFSSREVGPVINPVPGAIEYIQMLRENGHKIRVITSRNQEEMGILIPEMINHGLDLPVTAVGYKDDKKEACRGLGIYVDDDLEKLESVIEIVPYRFMFRWGYNEHMDVDTYVATSVWSWPELYREIIDIDLKH
jgi:hypothetical protein